MLEASGELLPEQAPGLRARRFSVPAGAAALVLSFDYTPRASTDRALNQREVEGAIDEQREAARRAEALEERGQAPARPQLEQLHGTLRNLLNLTLVDATGAVRGRWDRNLLGEQPAPDVLTEGWATPGFIAGPLPAGEWTVTLEAHQLLTPCSYRLRLDALADASAAPTAGLPGRSPEPAPDRRRRRPPPAREYHQPLDGGWLRGELHCHTTASDGRYEPTELVERAAAVGLDFLALTDHNTLAEPFPDADGSPLPLLRGVEVTTFHGHFTAHGVERPPAWYEGEQPLGPLQLAPRLRAAGALFGIAHPFVLGAPICSGCRLASDYDPAQLDLLDVWSRGHTDPLADRHALALFDRLRAAGHPVVAMAGRDWHGPGQEPAHSGLRYPATVVKAAEPTPAGILAALRRGAAYLSVGPAVTLTLRAEGPGLDGPRLDGPRVDAPRVDAPRGERRAGLGERLELPAMGNGPLRLVAEVEIAGLAEPGPTLLRLLRCGGPELHRARIDGHDRVGEGALRIALPLAEALGGDVRLELRDDAGRPLVLTNPVGCVVAGNEEADQ